MTGDTGVCCTGYKCICTNLVQMSITHFSPYCSIHACMGLGSPSSSSVQRAPLSYISLMVPNSLSHCFLRKKKIAQSWSNTDCTIYPQRFDLALLKGNLFLWTRFPCQFSLFSPGLLRSLITTALVFVSLANLDFLLDHWYLYWRLDCSSSESPGKEDMGFHFAGEIEELIYCWRGK